MGCRSPSCERDFGYPRQTYAKPCLLSCAGRSPGSARFKTLSSLTLDSCVRRKTEYPICYSSAPLFPCIVESWLKQRDQQQLTSTAYNPLLKPDLGASLFSGGIMINLRLYAVVLLTAPILPTASLAQQSLVVGSTTSPVLRIGTEVPVRLRTELTTKNKALRVGQRFEVETSDAIALNGQVVIPIGTVGVGEVTSVTNKGMWGKSGHFDVRLLYLRVGDRQIRLSGTLDDKGVAGGVGAAAVSAIVFLPAGFFMTGTSARMPAGTIIKGSLDEDVPVSFADATPSKAIVAAAMPLPQTSPTTVAASAKGIPAVTTPVSPDK
jgi:hypothetical protein